MGKFSAAKKVVLDYFEAMEACSPDQCAAVLKKFVSESYFFRGVYPFEEQYGAEDVAAAFWKPLKQSLGHMQRRMDVFLGGYNKYGDQEIWVLSTGNFMGLFDRDWPGIKSTAKMNCLRYTEFHCVEKGKITKTTLFVDILGFMQMAGVNPLPPQTGKFFVYPGPRMHNGLLFEDAPEAEGQKTMRLINRLCAEEPEYVDERADTLDYTGMTEGEIQYIKNCKRYFADDMIWYGPCGIGASYTLLPVQRTSGPGSRRRIWRLLRLAQSDQHPCRRLPRHGGKQPAGEHAGCGCLLAQRRPSGGELGLH